MTLSDRQILGEARRILEGELGKSDEGVENDAVAALRALFRERVRPTMGGAYRGSPPVNLPPPR